MSNSVPPNLGGDRSGPSEEAAALPVGPQTPQRPRSNRETSAPAVGPESADHTVGWNGQGSADAPDDGWQRAQNPWERAGNGPAATPPGRFDNRPPTPMGSQQPPPSWQGFGRPRPTDARSSSTSIAVLTTDLKRRRSLIIALLAALIILALIAVLVIVFVQRRNNTSSGAQAEVVRGYLGAIAAGDSQRALGYLAQRPDKAELLTDQVLAASNKIAPMTGISVSAPTKGSDTVQAWYRLGGQRYQQQFTLRDNANGYLLVDATATADLSNLPKELTYRLDGAQVTPGTVTLFPGSYRLTGDNALIDLGKQASFVAQPQDRLSVSVTPQLTSTGAASVRAAIDDAIKGCLKTTTLKDGCGLALTGNGQGSSTIKDGTVKRSLSKEAADQLRRLKLIMDDTDPTLIRTTGISGNIRTVATCESSKTGKKSGKKHQVTKECTLRGAGTSLSSPQVRLAGDKLTVEWF